MPRFKRDAFMQPEITTHGLVYEVETTAGTFYVPGGLVSGASNTKDLDLADFVEGEVMEWSSKFGYLARMSAPGYMDCTDWIFGTNKRELLKELREMHGEG